MHDYMHCILAMYSHNTVMLGSRCLSWC